jgi:hypothetical protein
MVSSVDEHGDELDKTLNPFDTMTSSDVITNVLANIEIQELAEQTTALQAPQRPWRVSLAILEIDVQIILDITDAMVLGRANSQIAGYTTINLSPFNALEFGVSRNHAVIMLQDNHLLIRDNLSMNGTYLNNKKLKPNTNYVIHSGDHVNLGRMALRFDLLFNPYGRAIVRNFL